MTRTPLLPTVSVNYTCAVSGVEMQPTPESEAGLSDCTYVSAFSAFHPLRSDFALSLRSPAAGHSGGRTQQPH